MLSITINLPSEGQYDITLTVQGAALLTEIATRLTSIEGTLVAIQQQGATQMARTQEVIDLLNQIDTATNEVADDLDRLRGEIANGVPAEDVGPILARLDAAKARLQALAADPDVPVPPVEPPPA